MAQCRGLADAYPRQSCSVSWHARWISHAGHISHLPALSYDFRGFQLNQTIHATLTLPSRPFPPSSRRQQITADSSTHPHASALSDKLPSMHQQKTLFWREKSDDRFASWLLLAPPSHMGHITFSSSRVGLRWTPVIRARCAAMSALWTPSS